MTAEVQEQTQRGGALVRIVAPVDDIERNWQDFQDLKRRIIKPEDLQAYTVGSGKNKQTKHFIKKSGWRKIGTAFGISVERVSVDMKHLGDDHIAITHTVRAIAPGGRACDGVGSCDSHEDRFEETVWDEKLQKKVPTGKFKWKYNDVDGTAYTRAVNRAISDLVGGGEVSAEEMSGIKDVTPATPELPEGWQFRLKQLAAEQGAQGLDKLARFIFEEIGSRFLTEEQAKAVAGKLKAGATPKAPEPANQPPPPSPEPGGVTEGEGREIEDDDL